MSRRRKRIKKPDIFSELILPVIFLLAIVPVVQYQFTGGFDFSIYKSLGPLFKMIFLLTALMVSIMILVFFVKRYDEKLKRNFLVLKQKNFYDWFSMTPETFEHFIAGIYEKKGYTVSEVTSYVADHGIDVSLTKNGKRYAVQVKQYRNKAIAEKDLREFYGSYIAQNYDGGTYVTTSFYTKPAREWAKGVGMHLVDGDYLVRMIEKI